MSSNLCNGYLSEGNKISDAIQAQMKAEATTDQTRLHFSCDLIKLIQWGKKTRFSIMFIGRTAIVLFFIMTPIACPILLTLNLACNHGFYVVDFLYCFPYFLIDGFI